MRTWVITRLPRQCGRCEQIIPEGQPALRITFDVAPETTLWRCERCGGPAPVDLPRLEEGPARPAMLDRIRQLLRATAHDWKRSQSNDR